MEKSMSERDGMTQQKKDSPSKLLSLDFLRSYGITMRPYLLFVSGITGIAGLSFAPDLPILPLTILSVTFFLSYGFGQALTDCFQTDTDSLSSPYRPLTQGRIKKRDVLAVSLFGLLLSGIILTLFFPINLILSFVAIIGLATYTFFKRRWWGGPFYNAWIVALLCLIAYLAGCGGADTKMIWNPALLATLATVFFGYANFVLTGYYKDISADRETGYNTLPVVFGLKTASVVSDLFASLTFIACGTTIFLTLPQGEGLTVNGYSLLFAIGGVFASLLAQIRLHRVSSENDAHEAITPVVHSYLLLLSAIATSQKPDWSIPLILFYMGFLLVMRLRPMKQQI